MAFKIDNSLLNELGLGDIPDSEKQRLLKQFQETLELRVGTKIAQGLSDEQIKEFETHMEKGDEKGAMVWLGNNYPDYTKVVKSELEVLKQEIKTDADKIKASIKKED